MGDMGDDILKSLLIGMLICMVFIGFSAAVEYCLLDEFILHKPTFDSILLFVLCSAFFLTAMWKFYCWAIDLV